MAKQYQECELILVEGEEPKVRIPGTVPLFENHARIHHSREGDPRYYVSFFGPEMYRCWANWVTPGESFTAKQTNQYRFVGGGSGNRAQQVRMDKAARQHANRARSGRTQRY